MEDYELLNGVGTTQFWGYTKALNICKEIEGDEDVSTEVLFLGVGDLRHLLRSVAESSCSNNSKGLNVFIYEDTAELIARHLLLLRVLCDSQCTIAEKVMTFFEIYANTNISDASYYRLLTYSRELHEWISRYENNNSPVNLSHLKHKERDCIGDVLAAWSKGCTFDINKYRETRMRGLYGSRYEMRENMYDWNYHMRVKQLNPHIKCIEYKTFCETGVAFEAEHQGGLHSNITLASYTKAENVKQNKIVKVLGYWGDLLISPYHSFDDIRTSSHQTNEESTDNAEQTSIFTLYRWMHLIENLKEIDEEEVNILWKLLRSSRAEFRFWKPGVREDSDVSTNCFNSSSPLHSNNTPSSFDHPHVDNPFIDIPQGMQSMTITLLTGDLNIIFSKPKYCSKFDCIVFGNAQSTYLLKQLDFFQTKKEKPIEDEVSSVQPPPPPPPTPFVSILKASSTLYIESLRNIIALSNYHKLRFRYAVMEVCQTIGFNVSSNTAVPSFDFTEGGGRYTVEKEASKLELIADEHLCFFRNTSTVEES